MSYNPNYWKKKWEKNEIKFHENEVNQKLIKFFKNLNLVVGDTILVPLCGKTLDMLWLAQQGLNVIGIELSRIACQDFFELINVEPQIIKHEKFVVYEFQNIKIICGDLFELNKTDLPNISAIYDCKALVALPNETRIQYVKHLIACTAPLYILLIVMEGKQEIKGPPYSISDDEINLLYSSEFIIEKVEQSLIKPVPEHLSPLGWEGGMIKIYINRRKLLFIK